ncbi:MAG: NADH-quinone oxidoreductase subunit NuoE [Planctomycetota bacterium]|nr:MAG: NADH-quinone oxidoreductase subunit NuoE [Planctomycetota bacterium]
MKVDLAEAQKTIQKYRDRRGAVIPLLQEIQSIYGYVPQELIPLIAKGMNVYPVDIYGILTFYAQFYLAPRGRHIIKVCMGTACYIMGGKDLFDHVRGTLGIEVDETTKDGLFTLERVACLGCCGMGPVVVIDDKFIGRCTVKDINEEMERLQSEKAERLAETN